jgi:hypothetical protein
MFAGTPHQIWSARRTAVLLLASLIGLLVLVAPVGASAGAGVRITPVAILKAKPQPRVVFSTHRGFSLRPRFHIDPIPVTSTATLYCDGVSSTGSSVARGRSPSRRCASAAPFHRRGSKKLGLPRWTVEMYRQLGMDSIVATTRADVIGWAFREGRLH